MTEVYISVDIEASGPIPAEYSMLSLGACLVSNTHRNFYVELKPINSNYLQEALQVSGLSMEQLQKYGKPPEIAMKKFDEWVRAVQGRPVFVGFNATFDWSFLNYYFDKYVGSNPFGISGLDIKAYYMGMMKCTWAETTKKKIKDSFKSKREHTHNALADAIEQAELFYNVLRYNESAQISKG